MIDLSTKSNVTAAVLEDPHSFEFPAFNFCHVGQVGLNVGAFGITMEIHLAELPDGAH